MDENLLMIFTRNPILGKCKTRLAATIGDNAALKIYQFLLHHTFEITKELPVTKQVYYSDFITKKDIWDANIYEKHLQEGGHLGARMAQAFASGFSAGFNKIVVIGSDMYDLGQKDLEQAFELLDTNDFVVGPAQDGGYYLLGMTQYQPALFNDKEWGTPTVLPDTLYNLKGEKVALLPERNDVDFYEDIKNLAVFQNLISIVK